NRIAEGAGLKQSITSQHLKLLRNGGILNSHKLANHVFYSLYKKELLKLLVCIKNCCGQERK
ncbi:MAG: helix-turn-helix transcriptional regulator, partial [Candidatus Aureabacteria bacterium]|nr:helix-turn-helix transcriptional regulator [Candidatus Auribacterota bacterium]